METNDNFYSKNKTKIKVVCGVAAGIVVGVLLTKNSDVLVNSIKNNVYILGNNNTVTTELARRGHPGFLIQVVETGEVFASKNRALSVLNLNWAQLEKKIQSGAIKVLGEAL